MDALDRGASRHATIRRIDLELGLAEGAIALLRTGRSANVVIGGLRFGEALLPEVRRYATGTGVEVVAVPSLDDDAVAILFRRDDP